MGTTSGEQSAHVPAERGVSLLVALGTISLNALMLCVWLWWAFGTHNGFADMSVDMLKDPAVRNVVAEQIVDALEEQGMTQQVALAVGPALVPVVREIVGTDAFRGLFYAGSRQLHEMVFVGAQSRLLVSVDDAGAMVKDSLEVANPDLADKVPDSALSIAVGLSQNAGLDRAVRIAALAGWLIWPTGGVALGCWSLALVRSRDRRRTVLRLGLANASSGLFWMVFLFAAVAVVSRFVDGAEDRQALRAVFRSITHVLMLTGRVAFNAGLVVTVAALVAGEERIRSRIEAAWGWVRAEWSRPAVHGTVGAFIIAIGVLVAVYPEVMVAVVARSIGLILAFLGLVAVLDVVGARGWSGAGDGRESSTVRRVAVIAVSSCLGAAIVVGFGGWSLYQAMHTTRAVSASPSTEGCNGHVELCDRRLDQVVLAATHNSMSAGAEDGWFFPRQTGGIGAQLAKGVRGFLIDAHYGTRIGGLVRTDFASETDALASSSELTTEQRTTLDRMLAVVGASTPPGKDPEVYLCHLYCELGATKASIAFSLVDGFLRENPNEVVVLIVEDHVAPADLQKAIERSGLYRRALQWAPGKPLPTLRKMIESGRNVLLMTEKQAGSEAWLPRGYDGLLSDTPYRFEQPSEFSCVLGRGPEESVLLLANHWLSSDPADPALAATANSREVLLARVDSCRAARGRVPNLLAVDFYGKGDLFAVVDELNGVAGADARAS